jgi:hypothetical protein
MGRTDVRPRRHRGDVGGNRNDDSGRCRPRPGRSDIDDDGDRRVQYSFGNVPHGQIQAARRIETNDQAFRAVFGGFTDALDDVFGNGRGNGGADRDYVEDRSLLSAAVTVCANRMRNRTRTAALMALQILIPGTRIGIASFLSSFHPEVHIIDFRPGGLA